MLIFVFLLHFFIHKTALEETCLEKEYYDYYYDEQILGKCCSTDLCSVTFCVLAEDHREAILALKPAAPGRCISGSHPGLETCCSWQVYIYLKVGPSDNQLVEKAMTSLY